MLLREIYSKNSGVQVKADKLKCPNCDKEISPGEIRIVEGETRCSNCKK